VPSKRSQIEFTGGDEVAIGFSVCCLVYCLTWPFLAAGIPVLMKLGGGAFQQLLGGVTVLMSPLVLGVGFDLHRDRWPILLGAAGILLLVVRVIAPIDCCSALNAWAGGNAKLGEIHPLDWLKYFLAPVGATLMIFAHLVNRNLLLQTHCKRRKR